MAHSEGKDFHAFLGKIFNALGEDKIGKAGRQLTKLVRRHGEDPAIAKPVFFVLDQMVAKSTAPKIAFLTRNMARELPFFSGFGLQLLGKAKEIENIAAKATRLPVPKR